MDSINLNNSSCQEIPKIKKIYWQWYDNFVGVEPIKRYNEWRIKNIELTASEVFKQFTFDVTEWTLDEPTSSTENGPIIQKVISGFNPKFNEVVESYLNEMNRRPVIICYETFDGKVYLFGGKNPKSRFSFKKAISSRQGYTVEFINTSDESSLVIDDTDHFPSPGVLTGVTQITINGEEFATVPCGNTFDIVVKNEDDEQVGSIVLDEWIVPSGAVPDGVLLKWPVSMQYSSYRDGDEGWRNQAGLLDYIPPLYPEVVSDLDYSIGQNGWFQLKNNLKVGANSNKLRFVDVDGLQAWGATDNVDKITIDKLTGLGFLRSAVGYVSWNDAIDAAVGYSVTVKGVVYDDFFMISLPEAQALFNYITYSNKGRDPITLKNYFYPLNDIILSTTYFPSSTNEYMLTETWVISAIAKTNTTKSTVYVFDARSLITAP